MSKQIYYCAWCNKSVLRYPCCVGERVFCCKSCRSSFLSKSTNPDGYIKHPHLSEYNETVNSCRMIFSTRSKIRQARLNTGEGKAYEKTFGRHTHRIVAEQILGRPLKPGEVVHHIDANRRNNSPDNLMIFPSQAKHAAWHKTHDERAVMPL